MAGLGRRQEIVHEVDVAHQRGVPERCEDWVGVAPADQRARAVAAEIRDLCAAGLDRAGTQGGDTATERVQNVYRQLLARLRREIGERGASGIFGEGFDLGHGKSPSAANRLLCQGDENSDCEHRANHAEK